MNWAFEYFIPSVKFMKSAELIQNKEMKLGRKLDNSEIQEIVREGQNLYGEMNEKLFGRSGTITSLMRFMAFLEG